MRWLCWFGIHDRVVCAVHPVVLVFPWQTGEDGEPATRILRRCVRCGNFDSKRLMGSWSPESLGLTAPTPGAQP